MVMYFLDFSHGITHGTPDFPAQEKIPRGWTILCITAITDLNLSLKDQALPHTSGSSVDT